MSGELLILAERAGRATGPDRRIDVLVEIALNPDRPWIIGQKPGRFPQEAIWGTFADLREWAEDEAKVPPEINAPRFSASLDAAMQLVPEGLDWNREGKDRFRVPNVIEVLGFIGADKSRWIHARSQGAASPALGLTSAALRAHHAMLED